MKRFLSALGFALGLALISTTVAFAADGTTDPAQTGEIAGKLAGLVAAATLVERIVEMIWDFFENNILTASKFVKNASDYVGWAQNQVLEARNALIKATNKDDRSALETTLQDAEKRLSGYLDSPVYVTFKKKISMPLGIVLALIVAWVAQLRMFVMLNILPADTAAPLFYVDIIVTGLVIGTGSAPVHSLIGILQNTKDAVDAARGLYTGKALAEVRQTVELLKEGQVEGKGRATKPKSAIELERMARDLVDL